KYGGDTDSNDDTDDEIERARAKIEQNKAKVEGEKKTAAVKQEDDEYGGSTDEDSPIKQPVTKTIKTEEPMKTNDTEYDSSDSGLPELPDFFTDKVFFLYGDFSETERRLMTRYITAYNG
ncbi:hypothetical protein LOTGIDRAFT_176980, partial [Lottia gigantea]